MRARQAWGEAPRQLAFMHTAPSAALARRISSMPTTPTNEAQRGRTCTGLRRRRSLCAADTHGISERENAQNKQRGSSHRSRGASHVAEDCWPGRRGGGARGQAGWRGPRAVECRLFRPAITPRGAVGPELGLGPQRGRLARRDSREATVWSRVEFETAGKSLFQDASPGGGTVSSSQRSNRNR
eukprot:38835-Prymnesium_polylepis.1